MNHETRITGFAGALIYFLILIFPVFPGGSKTVFALLIAVSALTSFIIFRRGNDKYDYSSILLLPVAGTLTAILYVVNSSATIRLSQHLLIHYEPLTSGILVGIILDKTLDKFNINIEMKSEEK